MNIWLMDHYSNPPQDLGDARQYSNARELIRRGHEVHVIACSYNHLSLSHYPYEPDKTWANHKFGGVEFTLIWGHAYRSNFELARIKNMLAFAFTAWRAKWAKDLKAPDLIVGSCPDPFVGLAAASLASRYHVPFILEIRDPWPYAIVEVTGHGRLHPFVQVVDRLMRYLYAKAERIIMLSKHSTELLVEGGADASKIVWIPQGVDLHMSPQPKPAPVDGKFTVTYLGAHNKWNSLDTVLDAAKILRDTGNKDILFRFVGAGVSKPELMKRAHDEGLDNVRFDDPVGKNMVCQVQHNSNAFIINNRKDGVSKRWMSFNKLFDYLCAGRPVVFGSYTDNDPVRESGAGISVEAGNAPALADAVRFLSRQSPRQLFEYGMAGRRFVEANYSIPVLIDRFEAMACEITGLPAGSANERA